MFKSRTKKARSNLAALIALAVVAAVASTPLVATTLQGGPDGVAHALQLAAAAQQAAPATVQLASN